jgi:hypothetical protein
MIRSILILALVATAVATPILTRATLREADPQILGTPPASEEFYRRVLEVEKHWDVFIRTLFGCQPAPSVTGPDTCRPNLGSIDYSSYSKWMKAARKLMEEKDVPCGK